MSVRLALQRLPRETRDTLFLLGVIAWTTLPHWERLPIWGGPMVLGVIFWRAWLAWHTRPLPGAWVLGLVLGVACFLTWRTHGTLLGREPGLTLITVLMALKTLELRARRDAFVVFFLGFFLVLTHFLYSQSLLTGLSMLVSVWGLLTALVLAHMPVGQPHLLKASRTAAMAALMGAPIMVVLFLLFPRLGPLWSLPGQTTASTGLSMAMKVGSMADLVQNEDIALRLHFDGPAPDPRSIYVRGPVLTFFDGSEWLPSVLVNRAMRGSFSSRTPPAARGQGQSYTMTLEPQRLPVLPLPESTHELMRIEGADDLRPVWLNGTQEWVLARPVIERLQVTARWLPPQPMLGLKDQPTKARWPTGAGDASSRLMRFELEEARTLPVGTNPRLVQWATELKQGQGPNSSPMALARQVLQHLRDQPYYYTLSPGTYGEQNPKHALDEFFFDRRQGFCEHYAAAFTVLMRAMDVPARVVTGYQGADPVLQDGVMVIRQSAAHAWAEFWVDGLGWVGADPTAAVAPQRVQQGVALRPAPGLMAQGLGQLHPDLLRQTRLFWESLNHRWNQTVLQWGSRRQLDLLKDLGWQSPNWADLLRVMAALLAFATLIGAGLSWYRRQHHNPWVRLHQDLARQLLAKGVVVTLQDGPRTMAARAKAAHGPRANDLIHALHAWDALRYGPGTTGSTPPRQLQRTLRRAVQALPAKAISNASPTSASQAA